MAAWETTAGDWTWRTFDSGTATADSDGKATLVFGFGASEDHLVPVGRHLLVLGQSGAIYDSGTSGTPAYVSTHLRFYRRQDPPPATLEVP